MVLVKRTLVALAVAALALGGCSSNDEGSPAVAEPAAAETSSATASEVPLVDLCPEVEAVLSERVNAADAMDVGDYQVLRGHLEALSATGDTEAANAVDVLVRSTTDAITALADTDPTAAKLNARANLRAGIGSFAERCAIVGSSALQ